MPHSITEGLRIHRRPHDLRIEAAAVSDGFYRVKRVCMDSKIIESFCSECPFSNTCKEISGAIDLESHVDSYGSDGTADLETMEFVKDLIVT
ncbi:hypothetical protein QL285_039183 [Trifolium repens]|nr:hypothetical protein QL285_039183 [Trifolium repens]